ncbi:hypothetical protein BJF79_03825 [Actinomadura sp. CNU-125]|uniref:hypothetical protein n=1 Tax=Actinomadura sp. CNU-125 TaxID=1904961 RepID=UPI00095CA99E|nr:hypothetical protein [Actinomadura sp. CNU-125]OLT13038.1 hypothetical protein BJF79_03825 [Actinomadura sp. CNU-125]
MPEPPAPRPQDVPDELLDVAWRAELARWSPGASAEQIEEYCDFAAHPSMASHREELRPVVVAVLAAHERMVREQAAREIHDRAAAYADVPTGPRASFRRGMEAAARHIAPTPTPGEIADAIRRGDAMFCSPPEESE